jgi:peptidylprolyl isomerase
MGRRSASDTPVDRAKEVTMREVRPGDRVAVHCIGWFDDGAEFYRTDAQEPLQVHVGAGEVIPGFDQGLLAMRPGDEKRIRIPAEEAYGLRNDALRIDIPRDRWAEADLPAVGDALRLRYEEGRMLDVMVTAVDDHNVSVDGNHPLAGQALTFELRLVSFLS